MTQVLTLSLAGSSDSINGAFVATLTATVALTGTSQLQFALSETSGVEQSGLGSFAALSTFGFTPTQQALTNGGLTFTLTATQDQIWIGLKIQAKDTTSGVTSNIVTMPVNQVYSGVTTPAIVGNQTVAGTMGRDPFTLNVGAWWVSDGSTPSGTPPHVGTSQAGGTTGPTFTNHTFAGSGTTMGFTLPGVPITNAGTPGVLWLAAQNSNGWTTPLAVLSFTPGSSTMADAFFHAPANQPAWAPTTVTPATILSRVKGILTYLAQLVNTSNGQIPDPYGAPADARASANFAYAAFTAAAAGDTTWLAKGTACMGYACQQYAGWNQGTFGGPDFIIQSAAQAYGVAAKNNLVSAGTLSGWKSSLTAFNYTGSNQAGNWSSYAAAGAWGLYKSGVISLTQSVPVHNVDNGTGSYTSTGNQTVTQFIDFIWNSFQNSRINSGTGGLYADPVSLIQNPASLSVDYAGRTNIIYLALNGYTGSTQAAMLAAVLLGGGTQSKNMDPNGQVPCGGRTSDHLWVDAGSEYAAQAYANYYADTSRGNDMPLAKRFQRMANLTFSGLEVYKYSGGTDPNGKAIAGYFPVTKNAYPPSQRIGYQQASGWVVYGSNLLLGTTLHYNTLLANASIGEAPTAAEVGGYVLNLASAFSVTMADAGGFQIEIETSSNQNDVKGQTWSVLGITRMVRAAWDGRLGPSDGYSANGTTNNGASFGPAWLESAVWKDLAQEPGHDAGTTAYTASITTAVQSPALVQMTIVWTGTGSHPTHTQNLTLTPDGMFSQITSTAGTNNFGHILPVLATNGSTSTTQVLTAPIASTTFGGASAQNFLAIDGSVTFTSMGQITTSYGSVTKLRAVGNTAESAVFVYPATTATSDPSASSVRSALVASYTAGSRNFTTPLGWVNGTTYRGRFSGGGFGTQLATTYGGGTFDVTLGTACNFFVRIAAGVITTIETDVNTTATVNGTSLTMVAFQPQTVAAATTTPITVPVSSAAFRFAPGFWYGDSGRGGSVSRTTLYATQWFQYTWNASASPTLQFLFSSSPGTVTVDYALNGGSLHLNVNGSAPLQIPNITPSASNTIRVYYAQEPGGTRLTVTGAIIDSASSAGTAPAAQLAAFVYGDSISQPYLNQAVQGYVYLLSKTAGLTGYDWADQSLGGTGWIRTSEGGSWSALFPASGTGRWNLVDNPTGSPISVLDSAGKFSAYGSTGTVPGIIMVNLGTNEALNWGSGSAAAVTASVTGWCSAARGAANATTSLIVAIPFGLYNTTTYPNGPACIAAIKAGVTAANNAGNKISTVDLGSAVSYYLAANGMLFSDNIHPNAAGHAYLAPLVASAVKAIIQPIVVVPTGVQGLPYLGMGCQLTYENQGPAKLNIDWQYFTQQFCIPRCLLLYAASFKSTGDTQYAMNNESTTWAQDPNLNATNTGAQCVPILGITMSTLVPGDMDFDTVISGHNDAYLDGIITNWTKVRWKEVVIRWGYEDMYPTCPSGVDAYTTLPSTGHANGTGNYPYYSGQNQDGSPNTSSPPSFVPWKQGKATYIAKYIPAWRYAAHRMHNTATANNLRIWVGWGPCGQNTTDFDPRILYPDQTQTDGFGKQVDCHLPDFYADNCYGYATRWKFTGYDSQQPFTRYTGTKVAVSPQLNTDKTGISGWHLDVGSRMFFMDYLGGPANFPAADISTPLRWSGGWGMYESYCFALQQNCSMGHPEYGGNYVGGTLGDHTYGPYTQPFSGSPGEVNGVDGCLSATFQPGTTANPRYTTDYPWWGKYARSRFNWFTNPAANGLAAGVMLQVSFWQNQGAITLNSMRDNFPEFVANADAGRNVIIITNPTLSFSPLPAATIGVRQTVILSATAYHPVLSNIKIDLGVGAGPQTVLSLDSGATITTTTVTFHFTPTQVGSFNMVATDTAQNITSNSLPYVVGSVTVPNASITVPASIPTQTTGVTVNVQAGFNAYIPTQANVQYSFTGAGLAWLPLPAGTVWSNGGQVVTIPVTMQSASPHNFAVRDTTFAPALQSAVLSFNVSTAAGGGGTITVPAPTPAVTTPTITVSAPGTLTEASAGAGVTPAITITAANITGGAVFWEVITSGGSPETSYVSATLGTNGQVIINPLMLVTGDKIQVVDNTTTPTVTGLSSAVTIVEVSNSNPTIAISAPGTLTLAPGASTGSETLVITSTNLSGNLYWAVYTAGAAIRGSLAVVAIGAGGLTNIVPTFVASGDFVKVQNTLTSPTVTAQSSGVTLIPTTAPRSITVSSPGIVVQSAAGAGATVSLVVTTTGLTSPLYYSVLRNDGSVEVAPSSFALDASGHATISVLMLSTGDTVLVGNAAANPTVTGASTPITLITTNPLGTSIVISSPGVIQEASSGVGVTPTLTISSTNLPGGVSYEVKKTDNSVETGYVTVLPDGAAITVPASIPQQASNQAFAVQVTFNYVPNQSKIRYSAGPGAVSLVALPAGAVWDNSGQNLTIPINPSVQATNSFQVSDVTPATPLVSAILQYQVAATGGGGVVTVTPAMQATQPQVFTIQPLMLFSLDYIQAVDNTTSPTVTGTSNPVFITDVGGSTATIAISAPGTIQETTVGAGVSPTLTITTANLSGNIFYEVLTAAAAVESGYVPVAVSSGFSAVTTDTFTRANTSTGAAGTTTGAGNGWIDVTGGVARIQSNKLLMSSGTTAPLAVERPIGEAARDSRVVASFSYSSSSSATAGIGLRTNAAGTSLYICYIASTAAAGTGALSIWAAIGGGGSKLGQGPSNALTNGQVYTLDFSAVGANPTVVTAILTNASGAQLSKISYNDSTGGLQVAGQQCLIAQAAYQTNENVVWTGATTYSGGGATVTITPHMAASGDYIQIVDSTTSPTITVHSSPVNITDPVVPVPTLTLTVGNLTQATNGVGFVCALQIAVTNINAALVWAKVLTAGGVIETPFFAVPLGVSNGGVLYSGSATINVPFASSGDSITVADLVGSPNVVSNTGPLLPAIIPVATVTVTPPGILFTGLQLINGVIGTDGTPPAAIYLAYSIASPPAAITDANVVQAVVNPAGSPNTFYAQVDIEFPGVAGTLYFSIDGGQSWTAGFSGRPQSPAGNTTVVSTAPTALKPGSYVQTGFITDPSQTLLVCLRPISGGTPHVGNPDVVTAVCLPATPPATGGTWTATLVAGQPGVPEDLWISVSGNPFYIDAISPLTPTSLITVFNPGNQYTVTPFQVFVHLNYVINNTTGLRYSTTSTPAFAPLPAGVQLSTEVLTGNSVVIVPLTVATAGTVYFALQDTTPPGGGGTQTSATVPFQIVTKPTATGSPVITGYNPGPHTATAPFSAVADFNYLVASLASITVLYQVGGSPVPASTVGAVLGGNPSLAGTSRITFLLTATAASNVTPFQVFDNNPPGGGGVISSAVQYFAVTASAPPGPISSVTLEIDLSDGSDIVKVFPSGVHILRQTGLLPP